MRYRSACNLRYELFLWNCGLAIFSTIGTLRTLPDIIALVLDRGFKYSLCERDFYHGVTAVWCSLFAQSKVLELGDTAFVILRKKPLLFLHWYHHITVLIFTWYSASELTPPGVYFIVMNYTVHSIMYTYYALRALQVSLPSKFGIAVTTLQLSQMFVGIGVNIATYYVKQRESCHISYENLYYSFLMYFSYMLLFVHFFYHRYFCKQNRTDIKLL